MHHKAYVRLIDTHTKRHRRDYDLNIIALEGFLNVSTLVSVHTRVITRGTNTVVAQLLGDHLNFFTATTVDDAAIALLSF